MPRGLEGNSSSVAAVRSDADRALRLDEPVLIDYCPLATRWPWPFNEAVTAVLPLSSPMVNVTVTGVAISVRIRVFPFRREGILLTAEGRESGIQLYPIYRLLDGEVSCLSFVKEPAGMVVVKEAVPCFSSSVTSSVCGSIPLLPVPRVNLDSRSKYHRCAGRASVPAWP